MRRRDGSFDVFGLLMGLILAVACALAAVTTARDCDRHALRGGRP